MPNRVTTVPVQVLRGKSTTGRARVTTAYVQVLRSIASGAPPVSPGETTVSVNLDVVFELGK